MVAKATIDDYEFLKRLGQGAFAEVFLMREKQDKRLYAIKKVSKSLLKREGKIEQAIRERELLSSLNHQGIVKLYKAFHDPSYLYLVMEYCSKESLSSLLSRYGRTFPYSLVKCYASELVVILEVLRLSNIVHRDIKPENILICHGNHLKLVDFNCAKKLSSRKTMRNTFVGTLSYVAPEVILNSSQIGPEVDLWSFGCIIYQMLTGSLPFNASSQEEIYENIVHGRYFLDPELAPEASSLIANLLVTEPENRLGANSLADLKSHVFFSDIDFESLWVTDLPDILEEIKQEELKKSEEEPNEAEKPERNDEDLKIVFEGNVHMKKNIFLNQTRRLVLTNLPSIKFYSVKTKEERGNIDVSKILSVKVSKNSNSFSIECSKKTFEFATDAAEDWVYCIRKILKIT